jgi:hypothetical protein
LEEGDLPQYEVVQHGGNGTMKVAEGQIEVKGKRHKLKRATEQGGIFGFDEAKLNDVLDEASNLEGEIIIIILIGLIDA